MLKKIPPLLTPPALEALASMGHGDELLIADANFPKASVAALTAYGEAIYLPVTNVTIAVQAVLALFPLDTFVESPLAVMEAVHTTEEIPIHRELLQSVRETALEHPWTLERVERYAFYERAKEAFVVFHTADTRPYGNLLLKKGVLDAGGNLVFPAES